MGGGRNMNEEDEENPWGNRREYDAPVIGEENVEELEFHPFCGGFRRDDSRSVC